MLSITTAAHSQPIEIERNYRVFDIIQIYPDLFPPHPKNYEAVAALINNELVSLSDKVEINSKIELVYPDTVIGGDLYRRSLIFLLGMAWLKLCPQRFLTVSHSIGHAYYFYETFSNKKQVPEVADVAETSQISDDSTAETPSFYNASLIDEELVSQLEVQMHSIVTQNFPILNKKPMSIEDAIEIFECQSHEYAVELLRSKNENRVFVSECDDYYQLAELPLAPTTGQLKYFRLFLQDGMIVLVYPSLSHPEEVPDFVHNTFTHALYRENHAWSHVTQIECIGALNELNRDEKFKSYIQICEAREAQKIGEICKLIIQGKHNFSDGPVTLSQAQKIASESTKSIVVGLEATVEDEIKLVMISGPSSSGKTTFAMKLQYNLTVMGRNPLVLSMDNYFVNRINTPLGIDGKYDFEHVNAIDVELFNKELAQLLNGETIEMPIYDFRVGERSQKTKTVCLPYRGIVIIEGIHALNPLLTKSVSIQQKFGIFIQPLTSITLDERTRTSTRDYRLIRRIVRDNKYRNCSAERTIELFENVRKGEERWIFPNEARADVFFNTALDYELMVLATYVTPLLHDVPPESSSYTEARRILTFISWVEGANSEFVPRHSILREFIGGSAFSYD